MLKLLVLLTVFAAALAVPLEKSRERRWSIGTAVDGTTTIDRGYGYGVNYPAAAYQTGYTGYWGGYRGYPNAYQTGYNAYRGYPGYTGYTGYTGYPGYVGYSGYNGYNGYNGYY